MPASLDCIVCLLRQSLDAARFATDDPEIHERALKGAFDLVHEKGFHIVPPLIGQLIHREIRRLTNNPDPYSEVKRKYNDLMLGNLDTMRETVRNSKSPLETATRLAIGGNTIDFALGTGLNSKTLETAFEECLSKPITGDFAAFERKLREAKSVLYLCDNSGEIVCDRLLIEEILREFPDLNLTAGVRGSPVLNDATLEDAKQIGLDTIVEVIDNGNDGLGTIIEQCAEDFLRVFESSDLVIAKGLANYETLIEEKTLAKRKDIAFLFKSKCPFIADFSGTKKGDIVVVLNRQPQ